MNDELDDRLMALALGLDDDPELRGQIDRSPELRSRYERMQAEVGAIEAVVQAAVPEPSEGWANLSDERWSALKPYVSTATAGAGRRTAARSPWWRRWQTLAPAAATLVIAAAVLGVVMSGNGLMRSSDVGSSGGAAYDKSAAESTDNAATAPNVAPSAAGGSSALGAGAPYAIAGAAGYRTIVVAKAGRVADGAQRYTVMRTIKGSAPDTLRLQTEVDGELTGGTLAVLFLDPVSDATPCPTPSAAPQAAEPTPAPTRSGTLSGSRDGGATLYLYGGRCAAVVTLPAGVEPDAVTVE